MKSVFTGLLLLSFSVGSGQSIAGFCGGGKVIEVMEGGWNRDDLLVKIDYSDSATPIQHQNSDFQGYLRFSGDPEQLPANRLEAIRKLALTALVSGKTVVAYSHNNSCGRATQLALFAFR